jgi:hypothetical protein
MDVCVYSMFVLSRVSSGLATGWSLVQGVLPTVYQCKITEPHKEEAKARNGLERHVRRRRGCVLKEEVVCCGLAILLGGHSRIRKHPATFQPRLVLTESCYAVLLLRIDRLTN